MKLVHGIVIGLILVLLPEGTVLAQSHPDFLQIGVRDINQGVFGIPGRLTPAEEKEQGAAIDALLRDQIVISAESEVTGYLQGLAEAISARSDLVGPVRVQLGRNQRHLAFATMAGYLYVDEEIFKVAETEAELAGVLAHEVAHLAARHGSENTLRTRLLKEKPAHIDALIGPLLSISGHNSSSDVVSFWKTVRFSNEIEADELATQYLWNAGYDPNGLLDFLGRMKDETRLDEPAMLHRKASHPPTAFRRERIQKALKILPLLTVVRLDSSSFAEARNRLRSR